MTEPLVKKRKIAVSGIKDQSNTQRIKEELGRKDGIVAVDVDKTKGYVGIEYDLLKINFEMIEKSLDKMGVELSKKITEKIRRGVAKFTEQNELDNLKATPSSCCEDPRENSCKANQ